MVPKNVAEMKKYFIDIAPELSASDDAKRAALFLTIPPLPTAVRFATPAAPAWAAVAALAGAALPNWARALYGWPNLPGQGIATDIAMTALRKSLLVMPFDGLLPPVLIEAKIRWGVNAA
jgi:uncharacterized protein (DUF2236 family)